jgi:hypothetical protein
MRQSGNIGDKEISAYIDNQQKQDKQNDVSEQFHGDIGGSAFLMTRFLPEYKVLQLQKKRVRRSAATMPVFSFLTNFKRYNEKTLTAFETYDYG